jgi:hypothetical protein
MKQINRMERWFQRHDVEATKRKMAEWNIYDYEMFFLKIFETPLNQEEKNILYFYLETDIIDITDIDDYTYSQGGFAF